MTALTAYTTCRVPFTATVRTLHFRVSQTLAQHPVLACVACLVGGPAVLLGGVGLFAASVTLPVSLFMGWI